MHTQWPFCTSPGRPALPWWQPPPSPAEGRSHMNPAAAPKLQRARTRTRTCTNALYLCGVRSDTSGAVLSTHCLCKQITCPNCMLFWYIYASSEGQQQSTAFRRRNCCYSSRHMWSVQPSGPMPGRQACAPAWRAPWPPAVAPPPDAPHALRPRARRRSCSAPARIKCPRT